MKKVTDYLISLGLTKIEAAIYQGLLQTGPTTVKELSEFLRIKRITTHFNVESLIEKGLIVQTMHGARRKIMAEEPAHIRFLVEQKEKEIINLKTSLNPIVSLLNTFTQPQNKEHTEIKYYEGKRPVMSVYNLILKSENIYSFVNVNKIISVFPDNPKLFASALIHNAKMEMWEIIEDSRKSRDLNNNLNPRYHFRFLPQGITISNTDLIIFDSNVAVIHLQSKDPTALVVESESFAKALKSIHKLVWNVLSKE